MTTARAIVQVRAGEPAKALELVLHEKPAAAAGRVVVRMTARPVNPSDLITARNGHLHPGHDTVAARHPTMGTEGFGIVEETGEGVSRFRPGQRVIPLIWREYHATGQGSWQDFVSLPEADIVAAPSAISDDVAAQFFVNPWTAYGLLDDLAIPKGEYLLQTAAASVLGRQIIQLAKHWGLRTINVVRNDKWKGELRCLGADHVIDSETEDVVQAVKDITGGKGAYGSIDAVGGTSTKIVASCVRDHGKVLLYGLLSGPDLSLSALDLMRDVHLSWWFLGQYLSSPQKQDHVCLQILKLLEEKIITPLAGKKFQLEQFVQALEESEVPGRGGKVLLVS